MLKKETAVLLFVLYLIFADAAGQTIGKPIEIRDGFITRFVQEGEVLKPKELLFIMTEDEESFLEMQKAQNKYFLSALTAGAGGSLLAYQLFLVATGKDTSPVITGLGAGFMLAAIPFSISYKSHTRKAVIKYNRSLKQSSGDEMTGSLILKARGVCFRLSF